MLFASGTLSGQDDSTLAALRDGVTHYYSKREHTHFYLFRSGDTAWSNDDRFSDTAVMKITWLDKDSYTERYISGYTTLPHRFAAWLRFIKKHEMYYKITAFTPDYYIAQERLDGPGGKRMDIDTFWFREKTEPVVNPLFEKLTAAKAARVTGCFDRQNGIRRIKTTLITLLLVFGSVYRLPPAFQSPGCRRFSS